MRMRRLGGGDSAEGVSPIAASAWYQVRRPVASYIGAAVASGLMVLGLRNGLIPDGSELSLILPLAVVAGSTWVGGLGPGLLAFVMATLVWSDLASAPGESYRQFIVLTEGLVLGTLAGLQRVRLAKVSAHARLRHDDVIETIPDIYCVIDLEGNLVRWNRRLELASGLPTTELVGRSIASLCPEADRTRFLSAFRELSQTGRGEVTSGLIATDGSATPYQWTGAVLRDAQGRTVGVTAIGRDVTERTAIETRFREEIAERKLAEERHHALNVQFQRRLERIDALRRIDEAITAGPDRRQILEVILDQVMTQLKVDAADVLLCHHSKQVLEYDAGRGFRTPEAERLPIRVADGLAGRAASGRRCLIVSHLRDVEESPARLAMIAAEGFTAYAAMPLLVKGQVKGVLEIFNRTPLTPDFEWREFLDALAGQAAIAVDNAALFEGLQRSNRELTIAYDATIEGWARALDLRDKETEGHTRRVTEMTLRLTRSIGIGESELAHIRRGSLLHDIGKLAIPDAILLKPGPLTEEEREVMHQHPIYAYEWLSPIAYLRGSLDIPYCHHERWDGTGYPRGLKGRQIPLPARIFAAVDIWDALSNDRPYRKGLSSEGVRTHLASLSGNHLDPWVVEAFLRLLDEEAANPCSPASPGECLPLTNIALATDLSLTTTETRHQGDTGSHQ